MDELGAGSLAAIISSGLKRAAAGEEEGPECAWTGGEELRTICKSWSHSIKNSHPIQAASAKLLMNPNLPLDTRDLSRASQLLTEVNKASRVDHLYRGMYVSKSDAEAMLKLSGREFTLPLSSFSSAREQAEIFAIAPGDSVSVMIDARNIRGFDIHELVMPSYSDQMEHLVAGTFRVGPVYHSGNQIWMVLEEM